MGTIHCERASELQLITIAPTHKLKLTEVMHVALTFISEVCCVVKKYLMKKPA